MPELNYTPIPSQPQSQITTETPKPKPNFIRPFFIFIALIILVFSGMGMFYAGRQTANPKVEPISTIAPTISSPAPTSTTDYSHWPVKSVCFAMKSDQIVKDLGDGTYLYKDDAGTLYRGYGNKCM